MSERGAASPVLGAEVRSDGVVFGVFAKPAVRCQVRLYDAGGDGRALHELEARGDGYFSALVPGAGEGARYRFVVDGRELPDPYARRAPDGVHAPAQVTGSRYTWRHARVSRRNAATQIIYELHVGTFTAEGTYDSARERLGYLAELGVTTLELMPLSSSAGRRGWGYDGVMHFAPYAPYGTPDELRRFVDAAHGHGLAVILDVVYNHFGPSGNYLGAYCPDYFTSEFQTAWGQAPNFRHPVMRRLVLDNALYWLEEFRFDGLRLDAIYAIHDPSPVHVLRELIDTARERVPGVLLYAEDERNDPRRITEMGFDAVWADDFHHHVHVTLTSEQDGYYRAYSPGVEGIARAIAKGWSYEGQVYPPSGRPRGGPADQLESSHFIYCIQNHDQVGNRALGTRLCHDVDLDSYCLASVLLLFLPMTPLLFMGQEWAASAPFQYFTDHDEELGALVTAGRRREFASFAAFADPELQKRIPDPQDQATFERSKLDWSERACPPHDRVENLYRQMIALRRNDPGFGETSARGQLSVEAIGDVLVIRRSSKAQSGDYVLVANFARRPASMARLPWLGTKRRLVLSTHPMADESALGEGTSGAGDMPARSAAIFLAG